MEQAVENSISYYGEAPGLISGAMPYPAGPAAR
jgi:hypothetical protein